MLLDWPLGTIVAIVVGGVMLLVFLLITEWIINGIDCLTGTSESGECTVIEKTFTEEHTHILMAGKVMIPQHIDDFWELTLECEGAQGTVYVTQDYYNHVCKGSRVRADFVRGGLVGALHIEKLY